MPYPRSSLVLELVDATGRVLGLHFRKYGGKLLIKPSRASIDHIHGKVKTILQTGRQ